MAWGRVNDDRIVILGWSIPLREYSVDYLLLTISHVFMLLPLPGMNSNRMSFRSFFKFLYDRRRNISHLLLLSTLDQGQLMNQYIKKLTHLTLTLILNWWGTLWHRLQELGPTDGSRGSDSLYGSRRHNNFMLDTTALIGIEMSKRVKYDLLLVLYLRSRGWGCSRGSVLRVGRALASSMG